MHKPAAMALLFYAFGLVQAVAAESIPHALKARMDALSASLEEGGEGWRAYAELLHSDYTRWEIGGTLQDREVFLQALSEWWDYGMRVASREAEIVDARVVGDAAIVRITTSETFIGPDGESGGRFDGNLVNVWVMDDGVWKLLSADVAGAPSP